MPVQPNHATLGNAGSVHTSLEGNVRRSEHGARVRKFRFSVLDYLINWMLSTLDSHFYTFQSAVLNSCFCLPVGILNPTSETT